MRKLIWVAALLAMGAALAGASGGTESADREAIEALWVEYGQSRTSGEVSRMVAIHDPESLKMTHGGPMFRITDVADKWQAMWDKADAVSSTVMEVVPEETVIMGDYAYSMGTYSRVTTPNGGGDPMVFRGQFLTVLRKDADGNWKIYRDSYSSSVAAPAPAVQYSLGMPVNLAAVNSEHAEGSPRVSADGLELYFNSNRPGGVGGVDLWVARRPSVAAEWGEPVNLGPAVNTSANDLAATVSADGLELYFSDFRALRPGGVGGADLWVCTRSSRSSPWGEAVNLGTVVNTEHHEITPELSPDGLELYFETDRPGGLGSDDLWVSRRASRSAPWGPAVWLGETINGEGMDHCPNMTADGLTLFYDYTPPGGGAGMLMVVRRSSPGGPWGGSVNLGSSVSGHYASSISADGKTLYFASRYPGGAGGNDIWAVPITLNGGPVSK